MKMKKFMSLCALALTGCCFFAEDAEVGLTAYSPDGRNEIRLWTNPLAYEVARDGEVVIAKSEIGMKVDGKDLASDSMRLMRKEARSVRFSHWRNRVKEDWSSWSGDGFRILRGRVPLKCMQVLV